MPEYLIAVAVGPVQSFIAAARATHDLWFGSYVLSEVSKAVAFELHQQKAKLIFPNPEKAVDLQPNSKLNVANKLLALVAKASAEETRDVLKTAKQAARDHWERLAQEVLEDKDFGKHICKEIWNAQVNDVLELYSAWVKLDDSKDAYQKARERVEQLLSARKSTRDFQRAALRFDESPYFGLPKSSLDAAREAVLEKLSDDDMRRLRLSEGEKLDCPGIVKRLGGVKKQFPSVVRVALEAWLQPIPQEELEGLKPHYNALVDKNWATRTVSKHYEKLPFDGSLLFPDRIEALRQQIKEAEEKEKKKEVFSQYTLKKLGEAQTSLNKLEEARKPLYKKYGEPTPYYAILVADGDKMGELLDNQNELTHRNISLALNHFAQEARKIVENETHRGACVYAGGDDVMALLPIDTALRCADELRKTFTKKLSTINRESPPTLSVGLGIVHAMNPFSHSLDVARRAEKFAKNGKEGTAEECPRNALAIIVDVRSGVEIAIRGRWNSGIVERLRQWQECYNERKLSSKTPYDLLEAVQEMEWARGREDFKDIVQKEINRVLKKKRANAGTQELSDEVIKSINDAIQNQDIFLILNELRVARWLTQQKGA